MIAAVRGRRAAARISRRRFGSRADRGNRERGLGVRAGISTTVGGTTVVPTNVVLWMAGPLIVALVFAHLALFGWLGRGVVEIGREQAAMNARMDGAYERLGRIESGLDEFRSILMRNRGD